MIRWRVEDPTIEKWEEKRDVLHGVTGLLLTECRLHDVDVEKCETRREERLEVKAT